MPGIPPHPYIGLFFNFVLYGCVSLLNFCLLLVENVVIFLRVPGGG